MRKSILFSLMGFLMVLFPVSASASFAPADRQTFQCVTTEDCPGPTFVAFNSFTDAPNPDAPANGDERAFFESKDASSTSFQNGFGDSLSVHDGQRIMMRVYIHNDANPNLMGINAATAHNVSVMVQLPTSGSPNMATAYISSTNSRPLQISDTVSFSGSSPINVTLDRNSPISITKRLSNGAGDFATTTVTGVEFTDDNNFKVNLGDWPGGFNRHGVLTFMAIVHSNTVQPVAFTCSSLERSIVDNNRSTFTTRSNGTAAGATLSSYTFMVKDSSGRIIDSSTLNTNAQSAVYNFNQSAAGTYTVSSTANSNKGSANCTSQQIIIASPTATLSANTTNPVTAKVLPNTGASDVLGLFSGASLLGGAGHYLVRRYRR